MLYANDMTIARRMPAFFNFSAVKSAHEDDLLRRRVSRCSICLRTNPAVTARHQPGDALATAAGHPFRSRRGRTEAPRGEAEREPRAWTGPHRHLQPEGFRGNRSARPRARRADRREQPARTTDVSARRFD